MICIRGDFQEHCTEHCKGVNRFDSCRKVCRVDEFFPAVPGLNFNIFMLKFLVRLHGEYNNLFSFVETPRKFIIAELSNRKLGSSSVL